MAESHNQASWEIAVRTLDHNCQAVSVALDRVQRALQVAAQINEMAHLADWLDMYAKYVKYADLGLEWHNRTMMLRLEVERKMGSYLNAHLHHGGNRQASSHQENLNLAELKKLGIDRNRSSRLQKLASIPQEVIDEYELECTARKKEIHRNTLLKFAGLRDEQAENEDVEMDHDAVGALAKHLSQLVAEQRSYSCIAIYPEWPKRRSIGRDVECKCRYLRDFLS